MLLVELRELLRSRRTTDQRHELQEARLRSFTQLENFVQRFDLRVVPVHDDAVAGERLERFLVLRFPVNSAWGFRRSAVEVLLEIRGGDESVLSDCIGAVVTQDFFVNAAAQKLVGGEVSLQKIHLERAFLACGGSFVGDGDRRHGLPP